MATFFRALVMLSVLVGLPAAWIYYGPLPPEGQRVVDRVVSAAKEAVGWNTPPPPLLIDSADVNYQPPAPAWSTGAPIAAPPVAPPLVTPVVATEPAPARSHSFQEQVEPLLAQLRQFGVIEYALERWGDGGKLYRFRCEMPLGASEEFTQQFEAVAADPQVSVEQVVAEVSQWQLTHRSAGM
ncbi:MAG: hypothetical protein H0T51_02960 [Pirellulales bacterium]|nr:hypothetical protein [Pirellulales bacterium]